MISFWDKPGSTLSALCTVISICKIPINLSIHLQHSVVLIVRYCHCYHIQVTEGDRTGAVVARAIKKFSLKGSPADYTLVQLLEENSKSYTIQNKCMQLLF